MSHRFHRYPLHNHVRCIVRFGFNEEESKFFILFDKGEFDLAVKLIGHIRFEDSESVDKAVRVTEKLLNSQKPKLRVVK